LYSHEKRSKFFPERKYNMKIIYTKLNNNTIVCTYKLVGIIYMIIETKVYNRNQTTIPSEIRNKFNIKPNDLGEWLLSENGYYLKMVIM
jgi:AbrB family looped-hinge helix DNA binding protein